MEHRFHIWMVGVVAAGLWFFAPGLLCQVSVGNNVLLNLDGTIATSYAGGYENVGASTHGFGIGGLGNLNGSYYSPQFLSFTVSPFLNQSRDSSSYSAIMDSSGVNAVADIFSGSKFPGYVSYSDTYNSQSNYQLPGLANFKTNGDTQTFGVGWSANLPNPSVTMGFEQSNSDSSLYGSPTDTKSHFQSLFTSANYRLDGFQLSGGIHHANENAQIPEIEAGQLIESANSDTTTFNAGVSRALPLRGSTWTSFTREDSEYDSFGIKSSETADIVSGGLNLKPTDKWSTQLSGNYNDNLAGSLYQAVNTNGVLAPVSIPAGTSHSWQVAGQAQYEPFFGLYVGGGVSHEQQLFLGNSYTSTSEFGFAGYGHDLLGGRFNSSATVTRSEFSSTSQSMLGFISLATYIRSVGRWNVGGSFGYSENVQTILLAYTSSGYSYSVSATRPLPRRLIWTGSASGSSTLITQQSTPSNQTRSYTTGLASRWLGVSGGYSKTNGTGLLTTTGIVVPPPGVPPQLLPTEVSFGGSSYSVGVGSTPARGFTLNGSFVKAEYNTVNEISNGAASGVVFSHNKTEQANIYLLYKFRKVDFVAGYSRILQGFSASGVPGTGVTSYYAAISRWFRFF
ncbi:MAG TPA: hypothetical protein VEI26_02180 [Terriglobales bacterium]|nr:hypothetical protein [Terriglobales bacterium]